MPGKYPDQKFLLEQDQHVYRVLVEILPRLHRIVLSMLAQALVQAHKALILTAEARAVALMVVDAKGWTTASLLSRGTAVLFIILRWAV